MGTAIQTEMHTIAALVSVVTSFAGDGAIYLRIYIWQRGDSFASCLFQTELQNVHCQLVNHSTIDRGDCLG